MEELDRLKIDHMGSDLRTLLLSRGRISELDAIDATDYLLISSRSRDYDPRQGGWVGELHDAGISVEALELEPAMDLRPALPCWISREMMMGPGHYFKRLVVFEPVFPFESAAIEVWTVFQALRLFVGEIAGAQSDIRVVVPVLSSFAGEADFSVMLRMIFFAAASLAARGRWGYINIIVTDERSDQAQTEFSLLKQSYLSPPIYPENIAALVAPIKAQYPAGNERMGNAREHGVTERQAFAIHNYTDITYVFVNRALRREDVTDPEFVYFQSFMEALSSGLANLSNYSPGTALERYMNPFDGIEDIYRVSSVVTETAYTSTTYWSGNYREYKISVKGRIGKLVEDFSIFPGEREVLFDSSMLHLVSKIEEEGWVGDPNLKIKVITSDEVLANNYNIHFSHL